MKHSIWLASLLGCMVMVGCGETSTDSSAIADNDATETAETDGKEATFDFVKDADFDETVKSNAVVVANFTADW